MNRRNAMQMMAALAGSAGAADVKAVAQLSAMETRPISMAGPGIERLPVVGLGTWQTFDIGANDPAQAQLEDVMREFVALGGKLIDSSPMYGRSESVAGDIIAKLNLRDKLFVATKVWTSGKAAGIAQMEDSMKKLRARPIDLMQVHNLLDVDTHVATLAQWKRDGQVRYVGITHYTQSAYDSVARVIEKHKVDFLQINYSVGERDAEKRLLPMAKERGIAVIINRPFAGGELLRRLRASPLPAFAAEIGCASWAQLLLKFVLAHPAVTCAIPATSRVEHLRDNMAAGGGRMPDASMREKIVASIG